MNKIEEATLIKKGINVAMYNEGYIANELRFYKTDGSLGETGGMFYLVNEFINKGSDSDIVISNSLYAAEYLELDIIFAKSVYAQLKQV